MMGKNLAILGCGGHGIVVADIASAIGHWSSIIFFDDRFEEIKDASGFAIKDQLQQCLTTDYQDHDFFVALGDANLRIFWIKALQKNQASIATLIHPNSSISSRANIGIGSIVKPNAVIDIKVSIGYGCIINSGATISHGCYIGNGVHVCPGSHVAGNVKIGNCSWIGIGSSIIQDISIGENSIVGAGSVVICDIPSNVTVAGNPARIIKNSQDNRK